MCPDSDVLFEPMFLPFIQLLTSYLQVLALCPLSSFSTCPRLLPAKSAVLLWLVTNSPLPLACWFQRASTTEPGTENRLDSGSYRIPIAIQLLPALILGTGLFFLPESPRYFVIKGQLENAAAVLSRVRGQPQESEYIQQELAEIIANHEYEMSVIPQNGYFSSWANCFKGGLRNPGSNLRRTILGTSLQ